MPGVPPLSLRDFLQIAGAYAGARRLERLPDRAALQRHQQQRLATLLDKVSALSPFYAGYRGRPHSDWPVIGKREWMDNFDSINTIGARLAPLMAQAIESERTRVDAAPRGYSVGLSTGTSGARGLFVASRAERNRWAGVMLAKMLRGSLASRQRIALLLRAGSSLYESIGAGRLSFRFFDLAAPWPQVVESLRAYEPTLLVAPAQALRLLSETSARPAPARVVSCAEVLEDFDRVRIEAAFGVRVEQIYQATEGFLGATCAAGTLHLNEAQYLIEKDWLPGDTTRFVPVVTDLYRVTQPVIRYRLNDLLSIHAQPCGCGSATTALSVIHGRCDDLLYLDTARGAAPVFPDLLSRAIVAAAPELEDYEVVEVTRGSWRLGTVPPATASTQQAIQDAIARLARNLGAAPPALEFCAPAARSLCAKQRRVRGAARSA